MGNYRSRFDIIADILHVAKGDNGAKKTQIMYRANLSYSVLSKYLSEVLEACLIEFEKSKRCYVLTDRGREFLERYREYSRRNKHLVNQVKTVDAKKRILEELCSS